MTLTLPAGERDLTVAAFADARPAWPDGDLETVAACPVCAGALAFAGLDGLVDTSASAAPGHWLLMACRGCGSASLSPRPTRESINRAYEEYYTHDELEVAAPPPTRARRLRQRMQDGYLVTRFAYTSLDPLPVGAGLLAHTPLGVAWASSVRHLRLPRPGARLLDVGSGQGGHVQRMAALGWEATGIDFDPAAVAAGRRHGLDIREGDLLFARDQCEDASYDAITFSHVVEHLYEPTATARVAFQLLRPGAEVWVATPNFASLGRRVAGRSWRGLEPPRHITLYTAYGLVRLLRDAGFVDVRLVRCPPRERWYWDQSALIGLRTGIRSPLLSRRLSRALAARAASAAAAFRPALADEIVVMGRR